MWNKQSKLTLHQGWEMYKEISKRIFEKTFTSDGYPHNRRRDYGKYVVKNWVPLDSKYVVPYNLYLSKMYTAHINVELCGSLQSGKYL